MQSPYSPGSPLFLPNGAHIINQLTSFLRSQYQVHGFREVITPNIYKKSLWETSGHWENYRDDMYEVSGRGASGQKVEQEIGDDESYGLKPMNCPGHCLIFKNQQHSYRDLPIRYADFSALHRNEISGALSGLTRVRRFHQDDGHIFCRPQQVLDEIRRTLNFVKAAMSAFHLDSYRFVLSTRPGKDYIGTTSEWDQAEAQLVSALTQSELDWTISKGDGAFYGPKIDIILRDSDGKEHQTATIQLDFQLPKRFGLEYKVPPSEPEHNTSNDGIVTPVLIHRAIFGSLERFLALLIEHYNGRWPFWLSPFQAIVLPVTTEDPDILAATRSVQQDIQGYSLASPDEAHLQPIDTTTFLVDLDTRSESLRSRIRDAKLKGYNFIIVVGSRNLDPNDRQKVTHVDVNLPHSLGKGMEPLLAQYLPDSKALSEKQTPTKMTVSNVRDLMKVMASRRL